MRVAVLFMGLIGLGCQLDQVSAQETTPLVKQYAAARSTRALEAEILGATRAGTRIVAVGDHGVILLSDDGGKSFRQAQAVPTRAMLTAVYFVDELKGWAVGHWGGILATEDGGEHWILQRDDLQNDRPLFSVWFKNTQVGVAVGLWGLILRTTDGGKHWKECLLPPEMNGKHPSDKNLFAIFAGKVGELLIAAERGTVFSSRDDGLSWKEMPTSNKGTFWTGISLKSGAVMLAGVRGHLFRRQDEDSLWQEVSLPIKSSVTAMTQLQSGRIIAVGVDGLTLTSDDDGHSFAVSTRTDRLPLTAVVADQRGKPVVFSVAGPVRSE